MVFKRTSDGGPVAAFITDRLVQALQAGTQVLWLVSGGSAIAIAVDVSRRLQGRDLQGLTVTLADERYGPDNHPDSNWQQLMAAGFSLPTAVTLPVLEGKDLVQTAEDFAARLKILLDSCGYKLGFFGIGPDGHTSGILPRSPAVTAPELVCAYDGGTYQRITTTAAAIARLDEAVVYAAGETKWPVLDQLESEIEPVIQPAQILKRIPKLTIFNDYKGETA